jgi:hypothetical protein
MTGWSIVGPRVAAGTHVADTLSDPPVQEVAASRTHNTHLRSRHLPNNLHTLSPDWVGPKSLQIGTVPLVWRIRGDERARP